MQLQLPEIDALLGAAIAEGKLPGAVVAIGRSDGVFFERAYGHRALEPTPEPMTVDTVFDLASLTKPVATASATMALVQQGKLALDDYVRAWLPDVGPRARTITVRELLLHTSGLPAVIPLGDLSRPPREHLARLLQVEPVTVPSTRYRYSDIGFIWLGAVLERASGMPLDALVRQSVLAPLRMTNSGYIRIDGSLGATNTLATPGPSSIARAETPAWQARIAPTERTDARPSPLIRGEVHDPRAYRLGGVAGHAGLFSSAADLSRFARALLAAARERTDEPKLPPFDAQAVAALTTPTFAAGWTRTLGWDVRSPHSRNRGALLSASAFGHGGYTGTALWIDPEQDLFVVFLSNRVHPDGKGNVIELTAHVTDAAVRGVVQAAPCPRIGELVRPGVDVLRDERFARIAGQRVGLLTHRAARGADGVTTLDAFARATEITLSAVLTPEHGLHAAAEGAIGDEASYASDGHTPVPVYSLFRRRARAVANNVARNKSAAAGAATPATRDFSEGRRPTPEMLRGLDVLVIDLVDVGTRFYTYASTVREALIAASERRLPVLLLDRPNPLGGLRIEGPPLDSSMRSFVNHHPLPVRHGLSLGELARLFVRELGLRVALEVVQVAGYERSMLHADTGLPWTAPSPNLRSAHAALLYPAVGLLEGTNVSVGRGTDRPFELLGAPFIDGAALAQALAEHALPGLSATATSFTPTSGPHAKQPCQGVVFTVTDPRAYSSARTGLALIAAMLKLYPDAWDHRQLVRLLGHRKSYQALLRAAPPADVERAFEAEMTELRARRAPALLYPHCAAPVP